MHMYDRMLTIHKKRLGEPISSNELLELLDTCTATLHVSRQALVKMGHTFHFTTGGLGKLSPFHYTYMGQTNEGLLCIDPVYPSIDISILQEAMKHTLSEDTHSRLEAITYLNRFGYWSLDDLKAETPVRVTLALVSKLCAFYNLQLHRRGSKETGKQYRVIGLRPEVKKVPALKSNKNDLLSSVFR